MFERVGTQQSFTCHRGFFPRKPIRLLKTSKVCGKYYTSQDIAGCATRVIINFEWNTIKYPTSFQTCLFIWIVTIATVSNRRHQYNQQIVPGVRLKYGGKGYCVQFHELKCRKGRKEMQCF